MTGRNKQEKTTDAGELRADSAGTLERARETVRDAGRTVGRAAERAGETIQEAGRTAGRAAGDFLRAESDEDLARRADLGTANALDRTGTVIRGAAPAIGRGVETAVAATGVAISAAGGLLGAIIGRIAGKVGGWWNSSGAVPEMTVAERQACQAHFESFTAHPDGMTFELALPGYELGYVAALNPDYQQRPFEEIEPDLLYGFVEEDAPGFDPLREYTRYGYERGAGRA